MTAMLNLVATMMQTATLPTGKPLGATTQPGAATPALPFSAVFDDVAPGAPGPALVSDVPPELLPNSGAVRVEPPTAVSSEDDESADEQPTTTPPTTTPPAVAPQLPPALLLPSAVPPATTATPVSSAVSSPESSRVSSPVSPAASAAPAATADTERTAAAKPTTEPVPTTPAVPFTLPASTPVPTPVAAPAPAASPSPVVVPEAPQPALAAALGRLRHGPDGVHQLEIALHPADLGSVQVRVTIAHGTLDVTVACADPAARDAVSAALPSLHRDLAGLHRVDLADHRAPDRSFADARPDPQSQRDQNDAPDQQPRHPRRPAASDDEFERWM